MTYGPPLALLLDMQDAHYRLSILAKAIHHKNLSAAADHIGLSQPQLSRVIAKLEEDFQVVLLDRGVRRKSSWTQTAVQLSEIFLKNELQLHSSIQKLIGTQVFSTLRMGTLEGLSKLAMNYVHIIFEKLELKEIHLDIFEINDLEAHFESGDLDLIFSFKIPGKQKLRNTLEVGFQTILPIHSDGPYLVCSPYEFSEYKLKGKKTNKKVFLSNSLYLRKQWLDKYKGSGFFPSKIHSKPIDGQFPLYLIGSELLSPQIWQHIISIPRTEEMLNNKIFESEFGD